jgi:pyruvate/2-oxoglutarate dehydrogenase complex dihydrolipoamide dehydrogenase (E3) component
MADGEKVEEVVLGGEPGKYIAWELARQGRRTVVVERAMIGGSCPNIACLPSKNVINCDKVAVLVRRAAGYGQRTGPVATDIAGVRPNSTHIHDTPVGGGAVHSIRTRHGRNAGSSA